jgi:hypothetical protein
VNGSYAVSSSCIRGIPALSFSPAAQTGAAGTTLAYTMAVTNRDTAGCPATTFQAGVSVPAGWSDAISSPAVSLPPGASGTITSRVTSPSSAATGAYGISGRVSDGVTSSHAQTVAASYLVQTTDSTPPSAPTSLAASVRRKQVTLTWKASTDNVAVTGYRITRNGVVVSLTVNLNWTDAAPPAGVNTYAVAAYDAAGNVSLASNSVSVNLTSGRK